MVNGQHIYKYHGPTNVAVPTTAMDKNMAFNIWDWALGKPIQPTPERPLYNDVYDKYLPELQYT